MGPASDRDRPFPEALIRIEFWVIGIDILAWIHARNLDVREKRNSSDLKYCWAAFGLIPK